MDNPRERVLNTASLLFHQQGYNSTGINQIISEAKVAKASFYQHFKSKDDLCIAFLTSRHTFWFSELRAYTQDSVTYTQDSVSHKQSILAAFDFIIHMNNKENFRGCSFLNILSELSKNQSAILSVIQSHKNDLRKFFAEILGEGLLAAHIYLLFESAIIESQLFSSNELVLKSKEIVNHII
ncbi:TetR/AcrR family transcriptional regulator [Sphingobacterium detergens]|uniref:TetR family transcriptional regulator n=1 Tax=Sphingobacterium detergens TaxID=1145106 RepID=A0A420BGD7_SPHD1|nr:TetR/AcrR family transcriptional regulator [Sphingobacterium detergens]RKE55768.1 TetR family transcriptional regulator [Sphingobacterium detergens]